MAINIQSMISNVERSLNEASRKASSKSAKTALALGEINTKTFLDIKRIMKEIEQYDVLVGIPDETNRRKDGTISNAELAFLHTHGVTKAPQRQEIQSHVDAGLNYKDARKLVHELHLMRSGSPAWKIPPRPIIEPAIEDSKEVLGGMMQSALSAFLSLDMEKGERRLKAAGMKAQNVTRAWFLNPKNNWAPNSPITIFKKGSDRPLIDTGELRKSITYVVQTPAGRLPKRIKTTKEKLKSR